MDLGKDLGRRTSPKHEVAMAVVRGVAKSPSDRQHGHVTRRNPVCNMGHSRRWRQKVPRATDEQRRQLNPLIVELLRLRTCGRQVALLHPVIELRQNTRRDIRREGGQETAKRLPIKIREVGIEPPSEQRRYAREWEKETRKPSDGNGAAPKERRSRRQEPSQPPRPKMARSGDRHQTANTRGQRMRTRLKEDLKDRPLAVSNPKDVFGARQIEDSLDRGRHVLRDLVVDRPISPRNHRRPSSPPKLKNPRIEAKLSKRLRQAEASPAFTVIEEIHIEAVRPQTMTEDDRLGVSQDIRGVVRQGDVVSQRRKLDGERLGGRVAEGESAHHPPTREEVGAKPNQNDHPDGEECIDVWPLC